LFGSAKPTNASLHYGEGTAVQVFDAELAKAFNELD